MSVTEGDSDLFSWDLFRAQMNSCVDSPHPTLTYSESSPFVVVVILSLNFLSLFLLALSMADAGFRKVPRNKYDVTLSVVGCGWRRLCTTVWDKTECGQGSSRFCESRQRCSNGNTQVKKRWSELTEEQALSIYIHIFIYKTTEIKK